MRMRMRMKMPICLKMTPCLFKGHPTPQCFPSLWGRRWVQLSPGNENKKSIPRVLGIESSCDDTAAAIVDGEGRIEGEYSESQLEVHLNNGGIIPTVAKQYHMKAIDRVVAETLKRSKLKMEQVTAIAVTTRPGLPMSLWIGTEYAKRLALKHKKPLIPVHHMEAHATIGTLFDTSLAFPFLALLISGGHCQLVAAKDINKYFLLGETLNDAPGEVLDKVARRLKLRNLGPPYDRISGGEAIEIVSKFGNPRAHYVDLVSDPLYKYRDCNFSFSGFKNITVAIEKLEKQDPHFTPDSILPQAMDIAASLQHAIVLHLLKRLQRGIKFIEQTDLLRLKTTDIPENLDIDYTKAPTLPLDLNLVVSGGCAQNEYIASAITNFAHYFEPCFETTRLRVTVPRPKKLCTDNGIMIAWNGMLKLLNDNRFPGEKLVLYDPRDIEAVQICKSAPLGVNVSRLVTAARIRTDPINECVFDP